MYVCLACVCAYVGERRSFKSQVHVYCLMVEWVWLRSVWKWVCVVFKGAHTAFLFHFNGLKGFYRIYFLSNQTQTNSDSPTACGNVRIIKVSLVFPLVLQSKRSNNNLLGCCISLLSLLLTPNVTTANSYRLILNEMPLKRVYPSLLILY